MTPAAPFAAALAACIAWNIVEGGRAAQGRTLTRAHRLLGGLAAFLLVPALLLWVAGAYTASARAVSGLAWLWPLVAALACAQSVTVLVTRAAPVAMTIPFVLWNAAVFAVSLVMYAVRDGRELPAGAGSMVGAQALVLARIMGSAAFVAPWAVVVPLIAGARLPRSRLHAAASAAATITALALLALGVTEYPHARTALEAYDAFGASREAERGQVVLTAGLRILPEFAGLPPATALREDLALADSLDAGALLVRLSHASAAGLDSLERALEPYRRDSILLIAQTAATGDDADRVVRRVRPDYLVLDAHAGADAIRRASDVAHTLRPATRVAVSVARYSPADSAIVAWAHAPSSGIDAVFFSLEPGPGGALRDAASLATADRWMTVGPARREYWMIAMAAPAVFGERAQRDLVRHVIAWASLRPAVRGVIAADAADYDEITGFRTAVGRWRPVAADFARMVRALKESPPAPTP